MNLRDLTQEVNSALDYNPDLAAYKDQVARVVNRHYLQISSQYPWLFMQKLYRMTLRSDIVSKTTTESDESITNNNVIQVGRDDTYDSHYELRFAGNEEAYPTLEMLGNYLVINDTSVNQTYQSPAHGAYGTEYMITGIYTDSGNALFSGPALKKGVDEKEWPDALRSAVNDGAIIVDRPVMDPSTGSGGTLIEKKYFTDWTIEFRRYWLPGDCVEVLGIMDRGLTTPVHSESSDTLSTTQKTAPKTGRIMFLDSLKEEYLFLDRDNSGDPVIAMEGEPYFLEPPPAAPIVSTMNYTAASGVGGSDLADRIALEGRGTYEYCYTFVYAGVESPPSPVVSITHDEASEVACKIYGIIDASGLTEVSNSLTSMTTSMIKRMYRRKVGTRVSPRHQGFERWHHIGDLFDDDGSSIDGTTDSNGGYVIDSGRKTATSDSEEPTVNDIPKVLGWPDNRSTNLKYWTYHDGELHKLKVLDESGPRQSIRVYRPPSQDMDVEIRYVSRPKRLVADADTPVWPTQYHHVLVYKSLADVCLQHGMTKQSQLYDRKAEDLLDRMKQKYLARANRKYIRRGFDRVVFAGERWGTPSKI